MYEAGEWSTSGFHRKVSYDTGRYPHSLADEVCQRTPVVYCDHLQDSEAPKRHRRRTGILRHYFLQAGDESHRCFRALLAVAEIVLLWEDYDQEVQNYTGSRSGQKIE